MSRIIIILFFINGVFTLKAQVDGLKVSLLSEKPTGNIITFYDGYDKGQGNTSLAHDKANSFKWSGKSKYKCSPWGYFNSDGKEIPYIKRDRDLGQVFSFSGTREKELKSITVRTGFGTNVIRPGMYGKAVSLQIFEVTGTPILNNYGSDNQTEAFHGYPHNRVGDSISPERDDYYTGLYFNTLAIYRGAVFPNKKDFGFSNQDTIVPPDHQNIKGRFLLFEIPANEKVILRPGKKYAFLIMIDNIVSEQGFTLANNYYGSYPDGFGIRRDGNGIFPPVAANPDFDFYDEINKEALKSAHFPTDFNQRITIQPGTNGYPDVDTWRDFVFYVEAK